MAVCHGKIILGYQDQTLVPINTNKRNLWDCLKVVCLWVLIDIHWSRTCSLIRLTSAMLSRWNVRSHTSGAFFIEWTKEVHLCEKNDRVGRARINTEPFWHRSTESKGKKHIPLGHFHYWSLGGVKNGKVLRRNKRTRNAEKKAEDV